MPTAHHPAIARRLELHHRAITRRYKRIATESPELGPVVGDVVADSVESTERTVNGERETYEPGRPDQLRRKAFCRGIRPPQHPELGGPVPTVLSPQSAG